MVHPHCLNYGLILMIKKKDFKNNECFLLVPKFHSLDWEGIYAITFLHSTQTKREGYQFLILLQTINSCSHDLEPHSLNLLPFIFKH